MLTSSLARCYHANMTKPFLLFERDESFFSKIVFGIFIAGCSISLCSLLAFFIAVYGYNNLVTTPIPYSAFHPLLSVIMLGYAPTVIAGMFIKSQKRSVNIPVMAMVIMLAMIHIPTILFIWEYLPGHSFPLNISTIILDITMVALSLIMYVITRLRKVNIAVLIVSSVIVYALSHTVAHLLLYSYAGYLVFATLSFAWVPFINLGLIVLIWFIYYYKNTKNKQNLRF